MSEISDTKTTIVQILYKALSMWHCVSYILTVTQFQLNTCIRVFAISSGFICEVVMNKAARTNAFSFQIINSLIDTWPGLTVTLLICFTTDPIRGVASFSTLCGPG